MSTQEVLSRDNLKKLSVKSTNLQYTAWQILGVWLVAGGPMWLLGWVAYPALSPGLSPLYAGLLRMKLITIGLVWQFVLALIILYREEGNIRLGTISRRFWLNHPKSARSGETKKALWWWLIPLILFVAALQISLHSTLVNLWTRISPFFAEPEGYDFSVMLAPEMRAQLVGAWELSDLMFAYSGKRFRSNWFPIILHSGQSVFLLFLILGLVIGVA